MRLNIDWTAPAAEIRDALVAIWFERHPGVEHDGRLPDAEAWADQMFEEYAEPTPADKDGLHAANGRWLTAGELIDYLRNFNPDTPITVGVDFYPEGWSGVDWLNVIGATDPAETGESSIILMTRDDFDNRQW